MENNIYVPSVEYWIPAPKRYLKKIPHKNTYEISSHGRVRRNGTEIVEPYLNNRYNRLVVNIGYNSFVVHTMVARIFLKIKQDRFIVIVHKNGNFRINDVNNLLVVDRRFQDYYKNDNEKSSKFRGVSHVKATGKWLAQISINGNLISLGTHKEEEYAHKVYITATENIHLFEGKETPAMFRERIKTMTNERVQEMSREKTDKSIQS